jgi:putative DNA primase/helicase
MSASLAALGIHPRRPGPGEHRAACPACARRKARPRDDALAVKLEADGGAIWLCHRCGLKGRFRAEGPPEYRPPRHRAPEPPQAPREPIPDASAILATFRATLEVQEDDVAGRYLLGRGCILPPPGSHVRWLPSLHHYLANHSGPALVGLVTDPVTLEPVTLHMTWLRPDGSGKAEVDKPRLVSKGRPSKGVIRLWPDTEVSTGLLIGEGVETTLTAAKLFTPAWATMNAGNMRELPVLEGIEALTVAADNDKAGTGQAAADALARRWAAAGREVTVLTPLEAGADLNDVLGRATA